MSFILAAELERDGTGAWQRYQTYVRDSQRMFPPRAYALAVSDWYFDATDHRCPHDAWLEAMTLAERAEGNRSEIRTSVIRTRLLGAYHDGYIEFVYPEVFRYSLDAGSCARGLGDWRYDEFRVSDDGHLIHEIEWAGGARWVIEASDAHFEWIPKCRTEQSARGNAG